MNEKNQCFKGWETLVINPIIEHFKGNRDAVAYTKTYVSQWDSIKITLPNNLFEQMMQKGSIRVKTLVSDSKGKYRIVADNKIFYISQYKKYFELIWIDGVDEIVGLYNRHYDAAGVQNGLMRAGMVLSVYVNRKQWKDKSYGTKEKPMPVFLHRIISGDDIEERNKHALWRDSLQPGGRFVDFYLPPKAVQRMRNTPDSVNYKFAEYYLRYLLPEDEFERLFEEE